MSLAACSGRVSHVRTVPSLLTLARVCPSGLNTTALTVSVWPVRVASKVGRWGSVRSHNRTVLSKLAVARMRPSELNVTLADAASVAGEGGLKDGMLGSGQFP